MSKQSESRALSAIGLLVRAVERHILSFLEFDELGTTVRVSKQFSALTHDYARLLRTLVVQIASTATGQNISSPNIRRWKCAALRSQSCWNRRAR